ncbi:MAG: AraC family transcriptional regulator [Clostridia bacterium]|nr:AraC family transcriptional regulator [Clostridia bacterium]MBR4087294.1 AraC family transcriptional regulator [Clostridia bacterium]
MNVHELASACGFTYFYGEEIEGALVKGAYCCDLLSWVIGRAEETDALVTVMSNPNVIAVAVMAELPCVVFSEGVRPDERALLKAQENNVILLSSPKTSYETAVAIYNSLK